MDEDAIRTESVERLLHRVSAWIDRQIAAQHSAEQDVELLLVRRNKRGKTWNRPTQPGHKRPRWSRAVPQADIERARRKREDPTVKKMNDNDRRRRDALLIRLETARQQVQAAHAGLYDETVTKAEFGQHLLGVLHALTDVIERDAKRQRATAKAGLSNTTTAKRQPIYDKCVKMALQLRKHDTEIKAIRTNWKRAAMRKVTWRLSKDELNALGFPKHLSENDRTVLIDRLVKHLKEFTAHER